MLSIRQNNENVNVDFSGMFTDILEIGVVFWCLQDGCQLILVAHNMK